jgi:carbon-monoxide dehydrogenase small subunit
MQACSLLEKNPDPSEEDIKASVDSVYCRCTGYHRIFEAYKEAISAAQRVGKKA